MATGIRSDASGQGASKTSTDTGHGAGAGATSSPEDRPSLVGNAVAELLGTFVLLFFGVGAVVAAGGADSPQQKLVIAFGFGLGILAAIYAFGHVSGAHLNPAITLGFLAIRRTPASAAVVYVVAQLVGATLGVLAVDAIYPGADIAGTVTKPGMGVSAGQALLAEVILAFVLAIVVQGTAVDDRSEGPSAGLAVGLIIAAGELATVAVSGGSFNPARSFGSAIVSGEFPSFWVYVVGPIVGGLLGVMLYDRVLRRVRPAEVDELPG